MESLRIIAASHISLWTLAVNKKVGGTIIKPL